MLVGTLEQKAEQAERILSSIINGAICVAQPWDNRIDCLVKLQTGEVIGKMVRQDELSEETITTVAEELKRKICDSGYQIDGEIGSIPVNRDD